jgi:hypothetical protein
VVSFTLRPLYPRRKSPPGTRWIGGWMGHTTGVDDGEKRKFLTLTGLETLPLCHPASSQSLYRMRYHHQDTDLMQFCKKMYAESLGSWILSIVRYPKPLTLTKILWPLVLEVNYTDRVAFFIFYFNSLLAIRITLDSIS